MVNEKVFFLTNCYARIRWHLYIQLSELLEGLFMFI